MEISWICLNLSWKNVRNHRNNKEKAKMDVNFSKIWLNNLGNTHPNFHKWPNNSLTLNFSKLLCLNKDKDLKISLNKWINLLLNLKKWPNNFPTPNFSVLLLCLNSNNNKKNKKNLNNKIKKSMKKMIKKKLTNS